MSDSENTLQQIAQRVRELREIMQISITEMASLCDVSEVQYTALESGEQDFTVSLLQTIAKRCGIELNVLMFGEEPKMSSYFLTRKGTGVSIERRTAYKYQSLVSGFSGRKAEAFIVTVEPTVEPRTMTLNHHEGQEFNYVLEGRMQLNVGGKELTMEPGDSLYFDAGLPHGMKALDDKQVKFIAVIF